MGTQDNNPSMNSIEKNTLKDLKEYLTEEITEIKQEISIIKRGVYGDPDNKVVGLIDYNKNAHDKIAHLEKKISKLETFKSKLVWLVSLIGVGMGSAGSLALEYITKLK